jgi:hypothetical protein
VDWTLFLAKLIVSPYFALHFFLAFSYLANLPLVLFIYTRHFARQSIEPLGDFRILERKLFTVFDLIPRETITDIFASAVVQALQRHELCFFQELLMSEGYLIAKYTLLCRGFFDPVIERLVKSIRAHRFKNDASWLELFPPNEYSPPLATVVDFTSDDEDVYMRLDLA